MERHDRDDAHGDTLRCRLCGAHDLSEVVNLGSQALSGVFPEDSSALVDRYPLSVGLCRSCGLAQLLNAAPLAEMYGGNYGYRSGLNTSMVAHLRGIVRGAEALKHLDSTSTVLDIGANDGTLLGMYREKRMRRIAMDPTLVKFAEYYEPEILQVPDFFSAESYMREAKCLADVVTSVAMFYDLPDPVGFARDVKSILAPGGVWILEQSYTPWVLHNVAYDTICHEHLEYYSYTTLCKILDAADLRVLDVSRNSSNGASIRLVAGHKEANCDSVPAYGEFLALQESRLGVHTVATWHEFAEGIETRRNELRTLLQSLAVDGQSVMALGASTKGNVLLQTSGINADMVAAVGDINPDKWNRVLPGSHIPILPQETVFAMHPDFLLILPWHFRRFFIDSLRPYLERGGKLILPLPEVEIVGG
jgi:hypothetical protein